MYLLTCLGLAFFRHILVNTPSPTKTRPDLVKLYIKDYTCIVMYIIVICMYMIIVTVHMYMYI